jgi:hypothetical protein
MPELARARLDSAVGAASIDGSPEWGCVLAATEHERPGGFEGMEEGGTERGSRDKPQSGGSDGRQRGGSRTRQGGGSGNRQGGGGSANRQSGGRGAAGAAGRGQGSSGRKVTGSARKAAARRKREVRRRALIGAAAAMVVIAVVVTVLLLNRRPATVGFDKVTSFGGLSRNHTEAAVHYPQTPPVGGDHNPVWQNCGFYPRPIHNENGVHSMEHGTVWITYQPNLPKDQVDRLASIAHAQTFVLVSPYPGLPAPVVASAWGKQEWLHGATDPKLAQFVSSFRQGPQTPEPGAPCTGGTGTPQ